jgi:hypothetical protein
VTDPVLEAYADFLAAQEKLRRVVDEHLHRTDDHALVRLIRANDRAEARQTSLGLDLLWEATARDLPHRHGATSSGAWLSALVTMSPHTASERVHTALAFERICPATYDRLAAGDISYEQAAAITSVVTNLPDGATEKQVAHAERYLLDRSPRTNAAELRKLHKRVEDVIDPDGLLERERKAPKKRCLAVKDNHDGTQTVRWTDTDERVASFKAALNGLAAPQPAPDGTRDERTATQRRADAMHDLVQRALRFGDLPAIRGHAANVIVTISEENLRSGRGFGITTTGETLTAETVQRIACSADLHPLHIDGDGIPLKLGRSQRLASHAQWLALIARDGGCVGAGCTRPPEWCQAHHILYWELFGLTDIENLCLLCDFHHDQVHHDGWDIQIADDGHVELIPPEHVDPLQRPVRNTYWSDRLGRQAA